MKGFKRFAALVLTLCMLASMLPTTVFAETVESGTCGSNTTWVLDSDGTLTVSGTGAMYDYANRNTPWNARRNAIKKIVIESGVTRIGDGAFRNCINLISVEISESITALGDGAFYCCRSLTEINISDSVTSVGEAAFAYCDSLQSVTIGSGVSVINDSAFLFCKSLSDITILGNVTKIGNRAFASCGSLTDITIPGSVYTISSGAFYDCAKLTNVQYGAPDLQWKNIDIGSNNDPLLNATVSAVCQKVTNGACGADIKWELYDNGVLLITGTGAMYSWANRDIPWVTYKDTVKNVIVGEGVTKIGSSAFRDCSNLTDVQFPVSLTGINAGVFEGCTSLANVHYDGTYAQWKAVTVGGNNDPLASAAVQIPAKLLANGTCGADIKWELYTNGDLIFIGTGAMYNWATRDIPWVANKDTVKKVIVKDGITKIGIAAFRDCINLTTIEVPSSLTAFSTDAFTGCTGITDVHYNGPAADWANVSLGNNADILSAASLHYRNETIASGSIGTTISWVLDGYGVLTISGTGAMQHYANRNIPWNANRGAVKKVVIESGITGIGEGAFRNCTNLTSVQIPDTVTTIGSGAFRYCTSLTDIEIPASVTSLGNFTFSFCESLKSITIKSAITKIGDSTFSFCSNLSEVKFEGALTSIGNSAFEACRSLSSIEIPVSVTSIGVAAFSYCSGLKDVYYNESKAMWNAVAIGDYNQPLTNATFHCTTPELTGIAISTLPAKTEYWVGESLDTTDLTLTATYSDGSTAQISEGFTVSGFSSTAVGTKTVKVTYEGKTATFTVTVKAPTVTGIAIKTQPVKTEYWVGEALDITGLTLTENYSDGSTVEITEGFTVSGFDSATAGVKTITVTYAEATAAFEVTVNVPMVTGITISALPAKTEYWLDKSLDTTGLTLIASYSDGSTVEITEGFTVSGYNRLTPGEQTITVDYEGATAEFTVTVKDAYGGTSGDLTWTLSTEGTLIIFGTGAIMNGRIDDYYLDTITAYTTPWQPYRHIIKQIIIEDGITTIGNYAFYRCENLTDIDIADSITSIGEHAFSYCYKLSDITITDSITVIGKGAFADCDSLTDITIPGSVTSIGDAVFHCCDRLQSVVIEDGVKAIGTQAFANCLRLTSVTIPDSVTTIGTCAFEESGLTSVTIGNGVTTIESSAFNKCGSLGSIILPDGVTTIGSNAFAQTGLTSITIPDSVITINSGAFDYCRNLIDVYYYGKQVQWEQISIGGYNTYLTNANIYFFGDIVTGIAVATQPAKTIYYIGEEVDSTGLTLTATFRDGHTETITEGFTVSALDSATKGTKIVTVTYEDCTAAFAVTVIYGGTCGESLVWVLDDDGTLIISGTGAMDDFSEGAAPWNSYRDDVKKVIIGDGVTNIGNCAFWGCVYLTDVEIPDSVTEIGTRAFWSCMNLNGVEIPSNVTSIGEAAFYYCKNIQSITIPNGVTEIGGSAFAFCENLKSIEIPNQLTNISGSAFAFCIGLTYVTIPESVALIADSAFMACTSLTDVLYLGTGVQWSSIVIEENNSSLISANIICRGDCQHTSLESSVCTVCGKVNDAVIVDSVGNAVKGYDSFAEALDAVASGQTLQLWADAAVEEVILLPGVSLDMNGHTLIADSVLTYSSSAIVDTSADVSGLMKINEADGNMISASNSQLPVYDSENGGYRFFAIDVIPCAVTGKKSGTPKYWFQIKAEKFAPLYDLIQADADVQIKVKMTWDGQTENTYATANLAFTKAWADGYNANEDVYITVSVADAENLENFKLIPIITSGGVEISGDEM